MKERILLAELSAQEAALIYGGTNQEMGDLAESVGKVIGIISKLLYKLIKAISGKGEKHLSSSYTF